MLTVKDILGLDIKQYGNYDVEASCMTEDYVKENTNDINVGNNFYIATVESGEMILEINWETKKTIKLKDVQDYIKNENAKENILISLWDSDDYTSINLKKIYINDKRNLIILV